MDNINVLYILKNYLMKNYRKSDAIILHLCYIIKIVSLETLIKYIKNKDDFNKIKRINKILYNTKYE